MWVEAVPRAAPHKTVGTTLISPQQLSHGFKLLFKRLWWLMQPLQLMWFQTFFMLPQAVHGTFAPLCFWLSFVGERWEAFARVNMRVGQIKKKKSWTSRSYNDMMLASANRKRRLQGQRVCLSTWGAPQYCQKSIDCAINYSYRRQPVDKLPACGWDPPVSNSSRDRFARGFNVGGSSLLTFWIVDGGSKQRHLSC